MRTWSGPILALMRRSLPALAVYALVLQTFLAGAAPASLARDGLLCSEIGGQGPSHAPLSAHDGLCLLHCAQAQTHAAAPPGAPPLQERVAHAFAAPLPQDAPDPAAPAHARPGARAPPHA